MAQKTLVEQASTLSLEVVKSNFNIELQKNKYSELQKKMNSIVVSEDNIEKVGELLTEFRKLYEVVKSVHKEKKKPFWDAGILYDTAKKDYDKLLNDLYSPLHNRYSKVVQEVEWRRKKEQAERDRKATIKNGIESNIMTFSAKIASCETSQDLIEIERKINLEGGAAQAKTKYMEFLEEYQTRLKGLSTLIKDQKAKIKEIEKLQAKVAKLDDEYEQQELMEKIENINIAIDENKIRVQEDAVESATAVDVVEAVTMFPDVSARRSTWSYEVEDIKELQKKLPHLVKLVPDEEKIKELLKTKKTDGSLDGKDEVRYFGIKFYKKKLY